MNLDRPADAAKRFKAILDLRDNDDDLAAIPKAMRRRGGQGASPPWTGMTTVMTGPNSSMTMTTRAAAQPIATRSSAATQVRAAARIDMTRVSVSRVST